MTASPQLDVDDHVKARMQAILRELTNRYARHGYISSGRAQLMGLVPRGDDDTTFEAARQLAAMEVVVTSEVAVALTPPMRLMLVSSSLIDSWRREIQAIDHHKLQADGMDAARTELQALVAWSCGHKIADRELQEATAMAASVLCVHGLDPDAASLARAATMTPSEKVRLLVPQMDHTPGDVDDLRRVFGATRIDDNYLALQSMKRTLAAQEFVKQRTSQERPTWRGLATPTVHGPGVCLKPCCAHLR